MKFLFRFAVLALLFSAACSNTPAPTALPPTQPVVPTTNAAATETAITQRVLATLTASAPQPTVVAPTVADTVTPPPLPTQAIVSTEAPTNPPPTLSVVLSPSVTPIPSLPTRPATAAPTVPPQPTTVQVSQESLRGKIMFKSTRSNGKYPGNFQFFVMDADGSNVAPLNKGLAQSLYQQLKPLEGYSPDKSLAVVGEISCNIPNTCNLYIDTPEIVVKRSQGQWVTSKRGERADKPVWSPDGNWIAFLWNRGTDKTKNIYKGVWSEQNQDYKRLTNFYAGKDTQDPTYSPDGSMLAFATQDGGRWQIWVLDATADTCFKSGEDDVCPSNPHSLSNSASDDWDPLWIK